MRAHEQGPQRHLNFLVLSRKGLSLSHTDKGHRLAQPRILENLIQNLRARTARQNFVKICGPRRDLRSHSPLMITSHHQQESAYHW